MFKKEFDVILKSTMPVNETMEAFRRFGIPINKAKLNWIYDMEDKPKYSCLIFTGKAFIPRVSQILKKNGFKHLKLNEKDTFM